MTGPLPTFYTSPCPKSMYSILAGKCCNLISPPSPLPPLTSTFSVRHCYFDCSLVISSPCDMTCPIIFPFLLVTKISCLCLFPNARCSSSSSSSVPNIFHVISPFCISNFSVQVFRGAPSFRSIRHYLKT